MQRVLSQSEVTRRLREHQARLRLGESLITLTEISRRAGIHRDTVYVALAGDRSDKRTQIRLSAVLQDLANIPPTTTRLMNVSIGPHGAKLGFGFGVGLGRR
jgi:hypothetical protein